MPVPDMTYRLVKGTPLTDQEGDDNFRNLANFDNALEALFGVVLNPDGTLKANSVNTAAIQDRAVTQAKLDWLANFFGTASGTNNYSLTISPTAAFTLGDGTATTFFCLVKFTNANTGPCTIDINTSGAKAINKGGAAPLVAGDIPAGSIAALIYDGTQFQIIFSYLAAPVVTPAVSRPTLVVGSAQITTPNALAGIDITLTKPAGTVWISFELTAIAVLENTGAPGTSSTSAGFTYQTAPETGTPAGTGSPGSPVPYGSTIPGQMTFIAAGQVLNTINTNNSITFRVALGNLAGLIMTDASSIFIARAFYQ